MTQPHPGFEVWGKLDHSHRKKDIGFIREFLEILAQEESNGGALGKSPRTGPVESWGGVSGEKVQVPNPPGEGVRLVAEISTYILASSEMQLPALFDFQ
jgi:hypothetical protein